jgi:hypothetical protein
MSTRVKKEKARAKRKVEFVLSDDGKSYVIDDDSEASLAIEHAKSNIEFIDKVNEDHGIKEKQAEIDLIRKGLANYQAENRIEEIQHAGWKSLLIERTKHIWIWTKSELLLFESGAVKLPEGEDEEEPIVPLYEIIKKKFRNKEKRQAAIAMVTKRVVDPAGVDIAVREGVLDATEIEAAYPSFIDATYVQVKPE